MHYLEDFMSLNTSDFPATVIGRNVPKYHLFYKCRLNAVLSLEPVLGRNVAECHDVTRSGACEQFRQILSNILETGSCTSYVGENFRGFIYMKKPMKTFVYILDLTN